MILITEEVCAAIASEIKQKGFPLLRVSLGRMARDQPYLVMALSIFIDEFTKVHGKLASEAMVRILATQYKMIETQMNEEKL
ncbi:hypothetical protein LCGC14_2635880 [marine sediment metagenome]|uniref:Uncharacterized protein n=1 Tax=marine sediment metagenome TaxID=412755 RepID=A0A0F8ZYS9_9ZZZZ